MAFWEDGDWCSLHAVQHGRPWGKLVEPHPLSTSSLGQDKTENATLREVYAGSGSKVTPARLDLGAHYNARLLTPKSDVY